MEQAEVFALIVKGVCPSCKSPGQKVSMERIECGVCGISGDPRAMRWCLKVPVYVPEKSGQFADAKGERYNFLGYAPGCGKEVRGEFCTYCRAFLPKASDAPVRKSRVSSARARDVTGEGGKD